jgi:1,2-diacylglycerol 3-beta-galactosyltransferase
MDKIKHILILVADAGFGHRSAANAVKVALEERYSQYVDVSIVNPLEDPRAPLILRESQADYDRIIQNMPDLYRFGYQTTDSPIPVAVMESILTVLLFEVLADVLSKYKPDAILCTYPMYQAPLSAIFKIRRHTIPLLTVITDLETIHSLWFHRDIGSLLLPNESVKQLAISNRMDPAKLVITGIPVHPDVVGDTRSEEEIRSSLGWASGIPTFLVVGSRRVSGIKELIRVFNHYGSPLQLVVVCGRNEELYREMQATDWHIHAQIYEYTDQMPLFMHAANGIVCKAGGLIVTESLACGLPIMLMDVIPGQETGNAEFVVENEAGDLVFDPLTGLETLTHWLKDDHQLLKHRAIQAACLGKPYAAYTVAEMVWESALQGPVDKAGKHIHGRPTIIQLLKNNGISRKLIWPQEKSSGD